MRNFIKNKPYACLALLGLSIWLLRGPIVILDIISSGDITAVSWAMITWGILGDLASTLYVVEAENIYPITHVEGSAEDADMLTATYNDGTKSKIKL